ncbi:SusC/RagA family TonB-linked outer membrane protein [Flagellimonas aurea]|uniref:SusC/RagA family TonB-linked outer membrane protein n=1 Tax=Flagellimonas aurea TaxID=2915619 RepID=UPI0035D03E44
MKIKLTGGWGSLLSRPLRMLMRILILLCCTTVFSLTPKDLFSQSTKITVDKDQQVSVEEVFEMITKQTKYSFMYPSKMFKDYPKVNLKKGKIQMDKLINQSLAFGNINIVLTANNGIIIQERDQVMQFNISGTITDSNGEPIPGATVLIKGTRRGVSTDFDGKFSILVNDPANVLVISSIGFKGHEITVGNQRVFTIVLEESVSELGEVVVNAGYYSVKKKERTGNIAKVTAEEIELQPVVSPIEALQGRMAGVEIVQSGKGPGAAPTIRIRGTNSLRAEGNMPLYIIDGMPINSTPLETSSVNSSVGLDPLNTMDMSNIQSIEVLKDADATAIYGSRGANGVILITTKNGRGLNKEVQIEARAYSGFSRAAGSMNLMNTEQYLALRRQAFENSQEEMTESNAFDLLFWDQDRYTDWEEEFMGGTSMVNNINLSASGGNGTTSFRITSSYYKEGTIFPGEMDYRKVTGGLNIHHRSNNKKLSIDFSANYGVDTNNSKGATVNFAIEARGLPPNAPPVFNPDGTLHWEEWTAVGWINPLEGYFNTTKSNTNSLISSLGVSYEVIEGLKFKTSMGYNRLNNREVLKMPLRSYNPATWESQVHRSAHRAAERSSWIIEPQVLYDQSFGKFSINTILGATVQQNESYNENFQASGYISESLIGSLGAAAEIINADSRNTQYKYAALFARMGFNWNKKYFVNLTGRRDGSSRFGPGKQWGDFGAIGAAWIFTEEDFVKSALPFLSFGKIRGSFGTTGNDQIGDYGFMDTYQPTNAAGGLVPTQLTNPVFSWETNKKLEIGTETGFLRDRIYLSASWYRNRSSNQLVGYQLPGMTGFESIQANLPATVQNKGWEFEVTTLNFDSKNFRWQTSINLSRSRNELLDYPDIDQSSYANTYRIGYPLNIDLLYRYLGIDPDTGFYQVADINGDERFDYEDEVEIRDRTRDYFGGLQNSINYKGFSAQFLIEFVSQDGVFNPGRPGNLRNAHISILESLEEGSYLQMPSTLTASSTAYSRAVNTDLFTVDASYIRMRNIAIGYDLPGSVLESLGLNSLRLFVNGQNLFTISGYNGNNPDSSSAIGQPSLRTITMGAQINF